MLSTCRRVHHMKTTARGLAAKAFGRKGRICARHAACFSAVPGSTEAHAGWIRTVGVAIAMGMSSQPIRPLCSAYTFWTRTRACGSVTPGFSKTSLAWDSVFHARSYPAPLAASPTVHLLRQALLLAQIAPPSPTTRGSLEGAIGHATWGMPLPCPSPHPHPHVSPLAAYSFCWCGTCSLPTSRRHKGTLSYARQWQR